MLGGKVDIDHSRQRQIGEKKPQSEDRDWSCFKVHMYNWAYAHNVCIYSKLMSTFILDGLPSTCVHVYCRSGYSFCSVEH